MKILVIKATVKISSKAPDASIGAELVRLQVVAPPRQPDSIVGLGSLKNEPDGALFIKFTETAQQPTRVFSSQFINASS